jgi:hypothetical protein
MCTAVGVIQEKRIKMEIANLEKDTGVKLRLLCQNYPETPGPFVCTWAHVGTASVSNGTPSWLHMHACIDICHLLTASNTLRFTRQLQLGTTHGRHPGQHYRLIGLLKGNHEGDTCMHVLISVMCLQHSTLFTCESIATQLNV